MKAERKRELVPCFPRRILSKTISKIVKGESNRAGLHAKIAEPNPIFCKDSERCATSQTCSSQPEPPPGPPNTKPAEDERETQTPFFPLLTCRNSQMTSVPVRFPIMRIYPDRIPFAIKTTFFPTSALPEYVRLALRCGTRIKKCRKFCDHIQPTGRPSPKSAVISYRKTIKIICFAKDLYYLCLTGG